MNDKEIEYVMDGTDPGENGTTCCGASLIMEAWCSDCGEHSELETTEK